MAEHQIARHAEASNALKRKYEPERSQDYRDINTCGSARVHVGDNVAETININHAAAPGPLTSAEEKCRRALFLTRPEADRAALISQKGKRVAGTCEWIGNDETYKSWLAGDTRLLWISGNAGKGKTIMSIFLTEEAEKASHDNPRSESIYFFCTAGNAKQNTATAVMRGLLYQLVVKRPQVAERMSAYFNTPEETQGTISSRETLWQMFEEVMTTDDSATTCIIDGLDECDEESASWICTNLSEFQQSTAAKKTTCDFKVIVVSRNMGPFRRYSRIRLDPDNENEVRHDITTFVSAKVEELSDLEDFNDYCPQIESALLENAGGTFLWVGFVMVELLRQQNCGEIFRKLKKMPKGLPAIYKRMLLQIEPEQIDIVSRMLRWVTLATRPLTLSELADAVKWPRPGIASRAEDMRLYIISRVPIFSFGATRRKSVATVVMVHQSARDYLLSEKTDDDAAPDHFRVKPGPAHAYMAARCFVCLDALDSGQLHDQAHEPDVHSSAGAATERRSDSGNTIKLDQEPKLTIYAQFNFITHAKLAVRSFGDALPLAELLVAHGVDCNRRDPEGRPLLFDAFTADVMEYFLGHVAFVSAQDNVGRTQLIHAVDSVNLGAVRALLLAGADCHVQDSYGNAAIHHVALNNRRRSYYVLNRGNSFFIDQNRALVHLLIEHGADVTLLNNNGMTAYELAQEKNQDEMIIDILGLALIKVDYGLFFDRIDYDGPLGRTASCSDLEWNCSSVDLEESSVDLWESLVGSQESLVGSEESREPGRRSSASF